MFVVVAMLKWSAVQDVTPLGAWEECVQDVTRVLEAMTGSFDEYVLCHLKLLTLTYVRTSHKRAASPVNAGKSTKRTKH